MTGVALAVAVLLLALNAYFVAVEFALVAASRSALEPLADQGNRRARRALECMADLNRQLAGAQLGITATSLALGWLVEPVAAALLVNLFDGLSETQAHTMATIVALAIVIVLHIVLGEMLPKNIALAGPEKAALALAPSHRIYALVAAPVLWSLNACSNLTCRLIGVEPKDELSAAWTPDELSAMVAESRGEGLIGDFEHTLLSGALHLGERPAVSVMVPLAQVVTAPAAQPLAGLEQLVVTTGHTRIPLVDDTGVMTTYIHSKDLFSVAPDQWEEAPGDELKRPLLSVSADRKLEDVLFRMNQATTHVAAVRDGETIVGIVTLEDVLESLVGDILDESDT
jgi:CBS domain containing-hemolysin-like protein